MWVGGYIDGVKTYVRQLKTFGFEVHKGIQASVLLNSLDGRLKGFVTAVTRALRQKENAIIYSLVSELLDEAERAVQEEESSTTVLLVNKFRLDWGWGHRSRLDCRF